MKPSAVFGVLWVVFFFHGMTPGLWVPALTNILGARGLEAWVPVAFVVPPLCALITPLAGGALADQRIAADRLFAWSSLVAAAFLYAAFATLSAGWHPAWFIILLGGYSLASGPSWGILATVSMTHLSHAERQFPLVRVGGTIGWVVGGLATSYLLQADTSPVAGYASAVIRVVGALAAFFLPRTPPLGVPDTTWKSRLGLDAFGLMKQRDHAVFFGVTALFSIPLAAFYMYAPEFLKVLGDARPAATMTVAQAPEVLGMLVLGSVMTRCRVKTVLSWALGLSVLRYAMSAGAGTTGTMAWHVAGVALHGLCYTFYFITAQMFLDRRVDPALRGRAQGLLVMVSGGLGPLAGAVICGWLRHAFVTPDGGGWDLFWGILAGMIAICLVVFVVFYRGHGRDALESRAGG